MWVQQEIVEVVKNNTTESADINTVFERIINNLCESVMTKQDKKLLDLAFSDELSQKELDDFLSIWDIETAGAQKALLASYIMKKHPDLQFTSYEAPRLKGLLNRFRFDNLQITAHYTKLGRVLNKEHIPLIIFKGGAIKYLRPGWVRAMGDIDIIVPEENYERAKEIALELGYEYEEYEHSVDLHTKGVLNGAVDIHRYIDMESPLYEKNYMKPLFERAYGAKVFGVDALVPVNEDLVFISLVNLTRNLMNKTSVHNVLWTLFDTKFLIESKPDFNWNIILENARLTGTELQTGFAIKFLNRIIPDFLPSHLQNQAIEKEIIANLKTSIFKMYYIKDMQKHCKELRLSTALKSFKNIKEYLSIKPKYFILKNIVLKNDTMILKAFDILHLENIKL